MPLTWILVSLASTFQTLIFVCLRLLSTAVTPCAAKKHGVIVTNTPDVLSDCVADLAIGLCIGIARKICMSDAFVRSGAWVSGQSFPLGVKFSGKRMGILGMGRIGLEIANRALAFKMTVSYHSRHRASVPFTYHDSLLDLAKNCDFLGNPKRISKKLKP